MVYEPREDSFLLSEAVLQRACGRVIDVGTGSGIQALAAMDAGADSVLAVDIDPKAVQAASDAGVDALQSDMFAAVDGMFDTIICNAPYLPDDSRVSDVALDGGPKGYEWTIRFLEQCLGHLSRDGRILLLISSLTNVDVVNSWLETHALDWEVMSHQDHGMERLFVYEITWALPQRPKAVFVAKGKRSRVYRDGDVAIKVLDPRRAAQEERMLRKANGLGIGPRLIERRENHIFMEFIDGVRIREYLENASRKEAEEVLCEVLSQCRRLDAAGIDKKEMTNPYKHIIVSDNVPVLIDWERARVIQNPHTASQFREYLRRMSERLDAPWMEDLT